MKKQAKARRGRLEDAKALFQLWEDHEEEEAWLVEKKRICQTGIVAKDLRALISLQQKHKVRNPVAKQNICLSVCVKRDPSFFCGVKIYSLRYLISPFLGLLSFPLQKTNQTV